MKNAAINKPCAEVIESSVTGWLAHCWQWNQFPAFGSLVTIAQDDLTLFGLVHQIQTGSIDPTRYPMAYQKTHAELLAEQPQIFEFLRTTFSCLTLGYQESEKISYQLAPKPAIIHAFVSSATAQEYQQFFADTGYLHVLFGLSDQVNNLEELLLALLKQLRSYNLLPDANLHQFIDAYSLLTGNEYRRLKLFLQRVQKSIGTSQTS